MSVLLIPSEVVFSRCVVLEISGSPWKFACFAFRLL